MSNGTAVVQSDVTITSLTRIYEQSLRYAVYLGTLGNPSAIVLGCSDRDLRLVMDLCKPNCLSENQIEPPLDGDGDTPWMQHICSVIGARKRN